MNALMAIAKELTLAAENARLDGDMVASLALSIKAAEYLQLARLLDIEAGEALEIEDQDADAG